MKIIMIEGIPGSGKTTIAGRIKEYYDNEGVDAVLYREGDLHPVDLAWCAVLSEAEYIKVMEVCSDVKQELLKHTKKLYDKYVVAYTHLGIPMKDPRIKEYLEAKEVYGGRVDLETFTSIHQKLWDQFFNRKIEEEVVIFECSYLQNHVNEMMLVFSLEEDEIIDYVMGLIPDSPQHDVELIYLDTENVKETIDRAATQRLSPDKSKWDDWIDLVIKYIRESKYGEENGCDTIEELYDYFEKRVRMEHKIMEKLNFPVYVIKNPEFDWEKVWERIEEIL